MRNTEQSQGKAQQNAEMINSILEHLIEYQDLQSLKTDFWELLKLAIGNDEFCDLSKTERSNYLSFYERFCFIIDTLEQAQPKEEEAA